MWLINWMDDINETEMNEAKKGQNCSRNHEFNVRAIRADKSARITSTTSNKPATATNNVKPVNNDKLT